MVVESLCILIIDLIVFALYGSLSRQAEKNLQMQAQIQQNEILIRHNEEIAGLYNEMRSWRHDYHNHLQVIQGYLQLGRFDKLIDYVNNLEDSIVYKPMPIDSGNPLIDALVGVKMLYMQKQNINANINIHVPSNLNVSDSDLCVLLGNLIDNAVEACQRITTDINRFIELEMHALKGQLFIRIRNSTNSSVNMVGTKYLSEKPGRHHGIGMKHIDGIVARYNGYINRIYENSIFETNIMLPIESEVEEIAFSSS
jgi:sensor histidine kinase regulating citrate/malate metabolism